ncbi:SpoIIE family protein phosphatase [Streptomyces anandii]|uniref:SpoIIE family protein phosphatase n=1 Tax=Streptomyces anandii TaxID=285454 RepID=UPI0037020309
MVHNPWQRRGRDRVPGSLAVRPTRRALDRHRLRHLLDAVGAVGADMDTPTVPRRIVEAATGLVAARYGALGVLSETGEVVDLMTVGIDEPDMRAAMGLPQGHGLLHTMVDDRAPLRVADVAGHPRSAGFPPGHPVMKTLMCVPPMVCGTVYGDLASVSRFSHEHPLPPGSTLPLFTDGPVERRGQDIDTGLDDLSEQAGRPATAPLDELCDTLVSRSRQVFDDDVAVLALRVPR